MAKSQNNANLGTDYAQRQQINAVFGDRWVANRIPDVLVQFQYGTNEHLVDETTTGTGAISVTDAVCTLSTGAGIGKAVLESHELVRYQPGFDGYCYFTAAISPGETGVTQRVGVFDEQNGYWIGCVDGAGIMGARTGGSDQTHAIDFDSLGLDLSKLNIYRIGWGWLGVAPVVFEVYLGLEKGWGVLHVHEWALNKQVVPSTEQPSHKVRVEIERTSGTGEETIKTCSWSAGRVGTNHGFTLPSNVGHVAEAEHLTVNNEQNLLTIFNVNTYNGELNKVVAQLEVVALSTDGNKNVRFRLYKGASVTASDTFTAVDSGHSTMLYFPNSSAISGGEFVLPINLSKVDNINEMIDRFHIRIHPGDYYTLTGQSASNNEVEAAIRWREEF